MIDLNIVNFITIGAISVAFYAALKYALAAAGMSPSWL